jgi:hypothetical protein
MEEWQLPNMCSPRMEVEMDGCCSMSYHVIRVVVADVGIH